MIELRWVKRKPPIPFPQPGTVLQYRQTYTAPNMKPFPWLRFWTWEAWVLKWGKWQDVPTFTEEA